MVNSIKFKDVKLESPSLHLVSGMPGGGKTATILSIAERLHGQTGKHVYVAVSPGQRGLPERLPEYVHQFSGSDAPLDSIFVTDDAHLRQHARRAMTNENVLIDQYHGQLRHDNIDYLLDTQTLKGIDVNNILRSNYRWHKKPYALDVELGRPEIKRELLIASAHVRKKDEAVLFAETFSYRFEGLVTDIPLPYFWSDDLSVMHRRREPPIAEVKRFFRIY